MITMDDVPLGLVPWTLAERLKTGQYVVEGGPWLCKRGHFKDASNVYWYGNTARCRRCRREYYVLFDVGMRSPFRPSHCSRGHEFTEGNTVRLPDERRTCRICKNASQRAWYHRKRKEQQ